MDDDLQHRYLAQPPDADPDDVRLYEETGAAWSPALPRYSRPSTFVEALSAGLGMSEAVVGSWRFPGNLDGSWCEVVVTAEGWRDRRGTSSTAHIEQSGLWRAYLAFETWHTEVSIVCRCTTALKPEALCARNTGAASDAETVGAAINAQGADGVAVVDGVDNRPMQPQDWLVPPRDVSLCRACSSRNGPDAICVMAAQPAFYRAVRNPMVFSDALALLQGCVDTDYWPTGWCGFATEPSFLVSPGLAVCHVVLDVIGANESLALLEGLGCFTVTDALPCRQALRVRVADYVTCVSFVPWLPYVKEWASESLCRLPSVEMSDQMTTHVVQFMSLDPALCIAQSDDAGLADMETLSSLMGRWFGCLPARLPGASVSNLGWS